MSDPEPPRPNPAKSRVIVGDRANKKAKPTSSKMQVHSTYGEIDMNSPLLKQRSRSGRGPRSSLFKWTGITVVIKLFRLSVKFVPLALAIIGGIIGYTYFFGSNPMVDAVKKQLGMEVFSPEVQEARVKQMLEQTKSAIAASDARVHLGNAIATGDDETSDGIETGQLTFTSTPSPQVTPAAAAAQIARPQKPAGPSMTEKVTEAVGEKIGDVLASLKTEQPSAPASTRELAQSGETISRTMTIETTAPSGPETYAAPAPPRQITIVQNSRMAIRSPFHDVDYRKGPAPSADFTQWAQSLSIDSMEPEFKPRVRINNMTFVAGNIVDFARGVTLAGISEDGSLVVFRDDRGAHVTVPAP